MQDHRLPSPLKQRRDWCFSPLGQRVLGVEQKLLGEVLGQVFGWQLLQVGDWGGSDWLSAARTQRAVLLTDQVPSLRPTGVLPIQSRLDALAVASDSVDAVLLPHTLEQVADPHELLREVERVLAGDGQLIVLGFRSLSLWGVRQLFSAHGFPPSTERFIGEFRLRDWLKLLGFEVMEAQRYLFTLPWGGGAPHSNRFFETVGSALWPLLAGGYLLRARKRVYTMTPIRPRWRVRQRVVGGLIETASRTDQSANP